MTRVLNTRPAPMNQELAQQLEAGGLTSVNYPVICNRALFPDFPHCASLLADPDCSWLFISKPAVLFFLDFLPEPKAFNPAGKVFAVGKTTGRAITEASAQIEVLAPEQANSEALVVMPELLAAKTVVLVKGVGGRGLIQQELAKQGINVIELDLYQRVEQVFSQQVLTQWADCNLVLATSVDIAKALLNNVNTMENEEKKHDFLQNSQWLVLSERIKEFLIQQHIEISKIHVCEASDNKSIIKLINTLAK